tara:strand:+ start:1032 stop:2315 length:1284 start_codon:yes stop_codon:yes gene_type:complete
MKSKKYFLKSCLTLTISLYFSFTTWGQSNNLLNQKINNNYLKLSGFSDDHRIKLLILNLLPSGLTEIAAEEISKVLQLNIFNTNHFSVLGPSEWNSEIKVKNPTLADCHDISCGTMIGKLFGADKVLVGTLHSELVLNENSEEVLNFILAVRMVDTKTNVTNFSDEVQFSDLLMHDELFRLAARLSENTILVGKILETKHSGIFLDIGRAQGIKTGHQLIVSRKIFKKDYLKTNINKTSNKNIAIAEVVQVSDLSAEAVIVQKILPVSTGDLVSTFIDKEKLIRFISQTRKELDTQKRLKPKKQSISLNPSFGEKSNNFENWSKLYRNSKDLHDRWLYITSGAGAATILFLSGVIKTNGILEVLPWLAGAGTIYSGFRYFNYRKELDVISVEGRSLGFISSSYKHKKNLLYLTSIDKGFQVYWETKF